jgi:penicillin amidase
VALGAAILGISLPAQAAHKCSLYEDSQGLPHVRGQSEGDAWACLGYLHGRDRAWQMDYFRRIAQGRSAEILGFSQLETDFMMRLLGFAERAQVLATQLSPELRAQFQSYADGVNFGMQQAMAGKDGAPYEFRKLHYQPDPWTVVDSLSLLYLESFEQTRDAIDTQVSQVQWLDANPSEQASDYSSDTLPWDTSILKPGEFQPVLASSAHAPERSLLALASPRGSVRALPPSTFGAKGRGSNNWIVDSTRSANGHALLANDPHLDLSHPPFWHHAHVSGGDLDAIGAAFPGIPQIISGANDHVAWGLTNSNLSVARLSFVPTTELKNVKTSLPVIYFKLGPIKLPFFFKTFQRTENGWPILPLDSPKGTSIVMRWTTFDITGPELDGLRDLMLSKSSREADQRLAGIGLPSWNFVFADDAGVIGYRAIGRVPKIQGPLAFGIPTEHISSLGTGASFPDLLSSDEMPHVLAPTRGYVATANNRQFPAGMNPDPAWVQVTGFRAFRIEEALKAQPKHDVETFRQLQCDNQAVEARFTVPPLLAHLKAVAGGALTVREQGAIDLLQSWDFSADAECRACGLYRRWIDRLHDRFAANENPTYRMAIAPVGKAPAFDAALKADLDSALDDLKVDDTLNFPAWGDLHVAPFHHIAGAGFMRVRPIGTPGDENSVNVGSANWVTDHYEHYEGPSQRLVVELTSPPTVYSILPGPDSDIAHPNPPDPLGPWELWRDCQLHKREFPVDWNSVPSKEISF